VYRVPLPPVLEYDDSDDYEDSDSADDEDEDDPDWDGGAGIPRGTAGSHKKAAQMHKVAGKRRLLMQHEKKSRGRRKRWAKMRSSFKHHHPNDEEATRFKASAGWQTRFMARHRIIWRRRNDNAKKGVAELLSPVTKFIHELRALRRDQPSADDTNFGK
jgi:hypothetical protein